MNLYKLHLIAFVTRLLWKTVLAIERVVIIVPTKIKDLSTHLNPFIPSAAKALYNTAQK